MGAGLFVFRAAFFSIAATVSASGTGDPDTKGDTVSKVARASYDQAQAAESKGDFPDAIASFDKAIRIDPKYAFAYDARGYVKSKTGDLDGAMHDYDTALSLDSADAETLNNRGNAEAAQDKLEPALTDYNQAIRLDPKFAHAYNGRGNACLRLDDLDQAQTDFESALHLDPGYGHAYNGRGLAELEQASFDEAVASFTYAINLIPQYAHGYSNRGVANFTRNRLEDALPDLREAVQLNPGDLESSLVLWLILNRDAKQREAATASLRATLDKFDPWGQELGKFLLGDVSQVDLVDNAFKGRGEGQKQRLCQAYFYIAAKADLAGDAATADKYYRQAQGTGVTGFTDYMLATAKIEMEPSYAGPKPMPAAVWIDGQVTKQGHFFLFTTDKPVEGDSMKNVVVLGAASGLQASMANIYSHEAERKSTVRFYGCLMRFADKTKDDSGPVPNVEFIVWKMHMPGDPDVLPEKQKVYFHDPEKY